MTSKYKYTKQERKRDEQMSRESERRTWPTEGEIFLIECVAYKRMQQQQQPQHQQANRNPVQQLAALEEAHLMALQHAAREDAELEALLQDDSDYKDDNFNNATVKQATIDGDDCKDDNSDDEYYEDDDPLVQQINHELNRAAQCRAQGGISSTHPVNLKEAIDADDAWDFQKKEPLLGPRFETSSIQF